MAEEKDANLKETKPTDEPKEAPQAEEKAIENAPLKGLLGQKVGMTSVFIENNLQVPVTVIEAAGAVVTQVKTAEKDGYNAVQVGYDDAKEKNLSKPEVGHFKKKSLTPKKWLHEFRVEDATAFKTGQPVSVSSFAKGDWVQVAGLTKGKGYAGTIKRHNFGGLPHSHGHGEYRRSPGSSGGQQPQRVIPGKKKPGHLGHVWSTVPKVQVVDVDEENSLVLVTGSIPGPNGNRVVISPTKKKIRVSQSAQKAKKKK